MIHPRHNVFCLFLILLISCWDVAASIVAEEIHAGVTVFVAEITSSSVFRSCFTALLHFVPSAMYNALPGHSVHVDSLHIWHAYIFVMKSNYSKSRRLVCVHDDTLR